MFARITNFQMDTSRRNDATHISETQIAPGLRQEPGFRQMYAMLDPHTGSGLVLTVWASQADEEASRARVGNYFGLLGDVLTAPPSASDVYDVVSTA